MIPFELIFTHIDEIGQAIVNVIKNNSDIDEYIKDISYYYDYRTFEDEIIPRDFALYTTGVLREDGKELNYLTIKYTFGNLWFDNAFTDDNIVDIIKVILREYIIDDIIK